MKMRSPRIQRKREKRWQRKRIDRKRVVNMIKIDCSKF